MRRQVRLSQDPVDARQFEAIEKHCVELVRRTRESKLLGLVCKWWNARSVARWRVFSGVRNRGFPLIYKHALEPVRHLQSCAAEEHQRCANKPAQGNALGTPSKKRQSPERAAHLVAPFQGFVREGRFSQGVALGWLVAGPLALRTAGVQNAVQALDFRCSRREGLALINASRTRRDPRSRFRDAGGFVRPRRGCGGASHPREIRSIRRRARAGVDPRKSRVGVCEGEERCPPGRSYRPSQLTTRSFHTSS